MEQRKNHFVDERTSVTPTEFASHLKKLDGTIIVPGEDNNEYLIVVYLSDTLLWFAEVYRNGLYASMYARVEKDDAITEARNAIDFYIKDPVFLDNLIAQEVDKFSDNIKVSHKADGILVAKDDDDTEVEPVRIRTSKINTYTCALGHTFITEYKDNGTTPMMFDCPKCGNLAYSAWGKCDQTLKADYYWYKPYKPKASDKEHVKQGGLVLIGVNEYEQRIQRVEAAKKSMLAKFRPKDKSKRRRLSITPGQAGYKKRKR